MNNQVPNLDERQFKLPEDVTEEDERLGRLRVTAWKAGIDLGGNKKTMVDVEEGYCPARADGTHCVHWWDDEGCCNCGHNPPPEED